MERLLDSSMPLALRPAAAAADLPAIAALMNSAFRGVGPNAGWNSEAAYIDGDRTSEAHLREELTAKPDSLLLVAEHPETHHLIGCVALDPQSPDIWYLGSLTIAPALQNSGLGRDLLAAAEDLATSRGARRMRMKVVHVRDTLIAWYQRRGYQLTGETSPFPYGDTRFGTPRRPDLCFVVLEKVLSVKPVSDGADASLLPEQTSHPGPNP